jgi:hypothetical protein
MAASTYLAQVQQLYIAYFGRPADPIGQAYWANIIDAAGGNIAAVQAGFSASAESQALFGNKSTIDKVTAIYQNAFGRAPEPAGLAYWVAQLDSGKVTQAQASWTIQQSAGAGDAAAVQNKLTAAQAFTAQIDTTAEIQGYQGTGAADAGRAFLATVNQNNASATAAVAAAPSALAAAVAAGGTGSTFVLTAGVDNLTGTSGNDTFTADNTGTTKVLGAADSINGGAGNDTLKVFLAAADTGFTNPTLTNVENVLINGGAVTAYTAAAGTTGLTVEAPVAAALVVAGTGAVTAPTAVTYTLAGQALTLKDLKGTTVASSGSAAGAATTYTTAVTSATDTVLNLTLNNVASTTRAATNTTANTTTNVSDTQTVDLAGAKYATLNLTATGTGNSAITLSNSGTALKTITIAGDKNLSLTENAAVSSAVTSINASTATGAVTVDTSAGVKAAAFTFTGGAGNDTLVLAATDLGLLTAGSQLNGGAGTDTLVIKDATLATADYAKLNAVVGFETLGFGSALTASTVDASQLTAIKSFSISANTVTETINNLGAGTSVAIASNTAVVLSAATGNTATEISVAGGVTVASLTTTGLTTLGLTSSGTTANNVTLANTDNTTVTVKGTTDLTLALAAGTATGSKVDGSAFTGKLTVSGSGFNDILIGGSGDDTITGGAGADTLTGGAGKDKFVLSSGATAVTADTITDFTTKVDTIVLGATAGTTANFKVATAAVGTFDLAKAAADAVFNGDTTTAFSAQQVGADTYVFYAAAAGTTTEQIVKLSGVALTAVAAGDFLAA